MISEIRKSIKNKNLILFVGSGLSASLGLPTWSQLIDYIANELGYNTQLFRQYGDNLELAEYYRYEKGGIGDLRSWMDTNWNVANNILKESIIYKRIVDLNIPIIYTTNYDRCLEKAFDVWKCNYKKIVSVEDIANTQPGETQIVKFHGDFSNDDSIVLTESSYFERLNFESPLDIKLRSDILGKSILFIGYSLTDINIRFLLFKLDKLWRQSNLKSKRPKSYIFLPVPNPIHETILKSRGVYPIIGNDVDKTKSTEEFLKQLL